MSFRPFSLDSCRAGLVALAFLACVGVSRAADMQSQPIQIVPLKGSTIDTNVDQSQRSSPREFDAFHAPKKFHLAEPAQETLPTPRPQIIAPTDREKEMLDRRKNWVFMTPEDMMGVDSDKNLGAKEYDEHGQEKKSATVMEKYYQRLYDSDQRAATNQVGKIDADSWTKMTNSVVADGMHSSDSPFNTAPDLGVFQPAHGNNFSDVFGSRPDGSSSSPDEVRSQEEQKAHIESFKQLWDIDQPAAAPVSASASTHDNSGSIFGTPQGGQSVNGFSSAGSGFSSQPMAEPIQPTTAPTRAPAPPRADFAPPQRPF